MDTLQNIFQTEMIQRLGWTLIHFTWQATAIALILATVLKMLKKSSASSRYIIACAALILIVLMPVITINMVEVTAENNITSEISVPVALPEFNTTEPVAITLPETPTLPIAEAQEPSMTDRLTEKLQLSMPYIVTSWLIGVFSLSLYHLGGWTQLQKLRKRMVKPVSTALKAKLKHLSNALGLQKSIALMESALVQVPTVLGHLKPIILLPASALTGLDPDQIEAILAHELAHIKRNDYLVNILQTVVEILGFYHPAVWWTSRIIRTERENACDDIAVSLCDNKLSYAKALTTMEQIRTTNPTLAMAASGANLMNRIKRLLTKDQKNKTKQTPLPSLLAMMLIGTLVICICFTMSCSMRSKEKALIADNTIVPGQRISEYTFDMTKEDVLDSLGKPELIFYSDERYTLDGLPEKYYMVFENISFLIIDDSVKEITAHGPYYKFANDLKVGDHEDKIRETFGSDFHLKETEWKDFLTYEEKGIVFEINKKDRTIMEISVFPTAEKPDYSSITAEEGVGFDDIIVGDENVTREFIISRLSKPDEDLKDTKTNGWWLDYRKQNGIDFWLDKNNVLKEIRFNEGFKGKLKSGISLSSSKKDVFEIYGKPIEEKTIDNMNERVGKQLVHSKNQTLYKLKSTNPKISKIYYNQHGLLFWFNGDKINQIVIQLPKQKTDSQVEGELRNIIRGKVHDEFGNAVSEALVVLLPRGGHPVKTGPDGKFEIAGPNEDRRIDILFVRDIKNNLAAAIEPGVNNTSLDITLTPGITLTGRVTDPQGKPIANVKVSPSVKETDKWHAGFGHTVFQPTDKDGYYQIKALPVGQSYSIGASARGIKGYGSNSISLGQLDTPGRKELDDMILEPTNMSVSGIVLDENLKPMSDVKVFASGKNQPYRKSKTDSDGRFKINGICKGQVSLDARTSDRLWETSGDEANAGDNDVEIYMTKAKPPRGCMLPPKNPPPSLIGKTLPDLTQLGIYLSDKDIKGKRILVCFFKLMHDESRNYIRQLAAMHKELTEKDIVIVAAQIWPRNEKQFRRWLKKNNVKFPVSILPDPWKQRPEQRPMHRWGMQNRVPWLILTDSRHIVQAEGFKLDQLGITAEQKLADTQSDMKITNVNLEPIAQGKNVVWLTVENPSDKTRFFSVNVYSRSVDYGTQGIGWGTNFYEKFKPKETKKLRYAYKIQGPITENTYVRLNFYNAKSLIHNENKGMKHFAQKLYKSAELKRRPVETSKPISNKDLSKTIIADFTNLQNLIKTKNYDQAFNYFSKDYKKSEYQVEPLKRFKRAMEPKQRLDAAFTWDKNLFLKLKQTQINQNKNKITLLAVDQNQTWKITFTKEANKWKIDDITGYTPKILDMQEEGK